MGAQLPKRKIGLWKVEGSPVNILGSLHVLGDFGYPLPSELEQAYADASIVVLEAEPPARLPPICFFQDRRTLESVLPPLLYVSTRNALTTCSADIENFQTSKPWSLVLQIGHVFYTRLGCEPGRGIEPHFIRKAKDDRKTLRELESLDEQYDIFDSSPLATQLAFLRQMVDSPQRFLANCRKLIQGWLEWDEMKMRSVLQDSLDRVPDLYGRLILERNRTWVPKIEKIIARREPTLVIVGALHLVGTNNLIALLQARGHKFSQSATSHPIPLLP